MKKKWIALILAASLIAGCLFSVSADEISDLEDEVYYDQEQLEYLNYSIDELQAAKGDLLSQIDETDTQLVLTLATISTLNTQIDGKTQQLAETTKALEDAEAEEATEYAAMKKRIQYLYEEGGSTDWSTALLEESDISDLLNKAEYTQKIYEYDRECLDQYTRTVQIVSDLKSQCEQEKTDLEYMLVNQQEQQEYLEGQLAVLWENSDNYDYEIAWAAEQAAAYADLINQQNAMIQALLAEQERQRLEAEAAAAAQAAAEAAAAQAAAEAAAAEAAAAESAEAEAAAQAAAEAAAAAQAAAEAAAEAGGGEPAPSPDPGYDAGTGNAIVDRAYAWVGRAEYVWGACSPGAFDCSGFVSYCVTGAYARIGTTYTFLGFPRVSQPQPGDICTNAGHCGIYVGDGMMVHASDYGIGVIVGPVHPDMIFVRY